MRHTLGRARVCRKTVRTPSDAGERFFIREVSSNHRNCHATGRAFPSELRAESRCISPGRVSRCKGLELMPRIGPPFCHRHSAEVARCWRSASSSEAPMSAAARPRRGAAERPRNHSQLDQSSDMINARSLILSSSHCGARVGPSLADARAGASRTGGVERLTGASASREHRPRGRAAAEGVWGTR